MRSLFMMSLGGCLFAVNPVSDSSDLNSIAAAMDGLSSDLNAQRGVEELRRDLEAKIDGIMNKTTDNSTFVYPD